MMELMICLLQCGPSLIGNLKNIALFVDEGVINILIDNEIVVKISSTLGLISNNIIQPLTY